MENVIEVRNDALEAMAASLEPALDVRGAAGWAAARNAREIGGALEAFARERDSMVTEYGEENGDGTWTVRRDSERWDEFCALYDVLASEEVCIRVHAVPPESLAERLTGREMLALQWMMSEGGGEDEPRRL